MSNPLAIAAVTATLRNVLTQGVTADPDLADATVTMQALDRARGNGNNANQLNIFLYHVVPSGTWRNADVASRVRPGETGQPVLGLNLYYLLTAFGRDNDAQRPFSHQVMGRAMSTLNDHPLLGVDEIKAALPNNDLWKQVERVRFTLQPFSVEEIAKLWTGFQTQYRLSVAYEAAVVLIESAKAITAPLPVLMRGAGDIGVLSQPNLLSPFPTLIDLSPPNQQKTVRLKESLTITGFHLSDGKVKVQFSHPLLAKPIQVAPQAGATDSELTVVLPNDPVNWPAGIYAVTVILSKAGQPDRSTNALPLGLSPQIKSNMPMNVNRVGGDATVDLVCAPEVRPEQQVSLLLGSLEVRSEPRAVQTNKLSFVIPKATPGSYLVRLRVDGTDSLLIDRTKTPPQFDGTQEVSIQ